jgi:hypothetical protein
VISTCKQFQLAANDRIVPALLQQGIAQLTTHLCHIFRTCLARDYTLKAWRLIKVMVTPKPGKENHTKAKAYCPISQSSFMLKMMKE